MFKVIRRIVRDTREGQEMESVYDKRLNVSMKQMFRLVFAVAATVKLTPKKLVKAYMDQSDEYANKFNEALIDAEEKQIAQLKASLPKRRKG